MDPKGLSPEPLTSSQLRNRRARILRDKTKEKREEEIFNDRARKSNKSASTYMKRLYIVIGTAIIVTICAGLNYTRPPFLFGKKGKKQRAYYLATMYPPNVLLERDLPLFFLTYSIATPENKEARKAAKRIAASRKAVKAGNGNLRVLLKAWDSSHVQKLLDRQICGMEFNQAYLSTKSQERRDDLIMWCLLATEVVEGFFLESVDMLESSFILARQRGIVIQSASSDKRISTAYYLHPRNLEVESSMATLPAEVLTWILANPEEVVPNLSEYRQMLQEYIHEAVFSERGTDNYLVLEEICQQTLPKRAIAQQCGVNGGPTEGCCYFVVPESEGGAFSDSSDDEDT